MADILLTIIVPIYNKEQFLRQCLESFAQESFIGRLEVLAIDDGSTDASLSIALEYSGKYPEIYQVIHKENGGVGSVLNLGLKRALGKYVREVDADDYVHKEVLGEFLDFLQRCNSDIVLSPYERIDAAGNHMNMQYLLGLEHGREYLLETLLGHVDIGIHSVSVRKQLLEQYNLSLEETRYYVDVQFIDEVIYHAKTCVVFQKILSCYRSAQAEQSVSLEGYKKNRKSFQRQIELKLERITRAKKEKISERKISRYESSIYWDCGVFYILSLMDTECVEGECKEFDQMLQEKYPNIYARVGLNPFIKELREQNFANEFAQKDRIAKIVATLQNLNNGEITLEDIYTAVLGRCDDVEVYQLRKQQEKFQVHFQLVEYWLALRQKGVTLADFFIKRDFHRVAIYGYGVLGQRLYQELLGSGVKAIYGIDRRVKGNGTVFPIYTPNDDLEDVDVVIVTVSSGFPKIAKMLRNQINCPILPLEDVVYGS